MSTAGSSKEVFQGFKALWSSLSALSYLGGPWRDKAEGTSAGQDGPNFPYVVFTPISNVRKRRTNTSEYWEHVFQLGVRDSTAALIDTHIQNITTALRPAVDDPTQFTLSIGNVVQFEKPSEHTVQEDKLVEAGMPIYRLVRCIPKT